MVHVMLMLLQSARRACGLRAAGCGLRVLLVLLVRSLPIRDLILDVLCLGLLRAGRACRLVEIKRIEHWVALLSKHREHREERHLVEELRQIPVPTLHNKIGARDQFLGAN